MRNLFNYIERDSIVHRMTGAAKFVCLLLWNFSAMMTYDTRFLLSLLIIGVVLFRISKIRFKDVSFMLILTCSVMIFNQILLFLFSPQHGTELYGTATVLFGKGRYAVTAEQLFYQMNFMMKYLATIPLVILFVCTTDPSEFAASLNKIGISYSISYAVALALRYIPDIQHEYHEISQAQQARGIEMSKKGTLFKRLKAMSAILIPMILASMDRIQVISNAMELRSFGKKKKRTWYMGRKFSKVDIGCMIFCSCLVIITFVLYFVNGGRFYNPFV